MKSGVGSSFLPEKTNGHRISPPSNRTDIVRTLSQIVAKWWDDAHVERREVQDEQG